MADTIRELLVQAALARLEAIASTVAGLAVYRDRADDEPIEDHEGAVINLLAGEERDDTLYTLEDSWILPLAVELYATSAAGLNVLRAEVDKALRYDPDMLGGYARDVRFAEESAAAFEPLPHRTKRWVAVRPYDVHFATAEGDPYTAAA